MTGKQMSIKAATDESHRRECGADQAEEVNCVHGTCYYTPLQRDNPFCECESGWTGTHCASMETTHTFPTWRLTDKDGSAATKQAVVVTIIAVCFLAIIAFTVYLVWRHRRKTRRNHPNLISNEQGASNESLQQRQKPAPFNNNIIINNKNCNNNTVSITIEPTSLDPILTTPQTPETPETTSRSLSCGDDVTGRSARRERLSAGDSWPADDVSESGDAGVSIVSEGQTPFAKFVSVL